MKPAPDKIQPPKAGGLVPLPTDRLISLGELTNATAAVVEQNDRSYRIVDHQTPGAIGHHSPRDAAKGMHRVALMEALDAGTVTARSLQTRVPYGELGRIDSNWDRTSLSYGLTYADAAKFCELLALEARPIDELSEPIPTAANKLPAAGESELQEQRQARRYQACLDAGLKMPSDDYGYLPRGIGRVAKNAGISRQAFSDDVKAHIRRVNGR